MEFENRLDHLQATKEVADLMAEDRERLKRLSWMTPTTIEKSRRRLVELAHEFCSSHIPDCRILDTGCGTGELAVELAETYSAADVVGIDLSFVAAEQARQKVHQHENALLLGGDALRVVPEMDDFDIIYAVNMVQDTAHPIHTLSTFFDSLTHDGNLILSVPGESAMEVFPHHTEYDEEIALPYMEMQGVDIYGHDVDWKQYVFPEERLQEIVEDVGFDMVHSEKLSTDLSSLPHLLELIEPEKRPEISDETIEELTHNPSDGPGVDTYVLRR